MKPVPREPEAPTPMGWGSYESWAADGKQLGRAHRTLGWVLAEWVLWGEGHYGERFAQGVAETGLEPHTIQNLLSVYRAFPASRRREHLSVSHHEALLGLTADEQDEWLDRAEKSSLSVTALRKAVRGAKEPLLSATGKQPGRISALRGESAIPPDDAPDPPRLLVGSIIRLEGGLAKITHIGSGPTILMTAVRL